jgi:hypothetical protein
MATQIKVGLIIVLAGIVVVVALAASRTAVAKNEFRFDAAELKDKKSWTQVNPTPYLITSRVAIQCAAPPTAADLEREKKENPHMGMFITVYVNNIGRKAMFEANPKFPVGSIIVKEKFATDADSRKPVLYTIMRKREVGYNPTVGDWEFSVVGANGKDLQASGKLENCQTCHVGRVARDFVFRDYLTWR